jgi:hypothetical protein
VGKSENKLPKPVQSSYNFSDTNKNNSQVLDMAFGQSIDLMAGF